MRRIHVLLPCLLLAASAGCDSDECVLDTDCADFQLVCIERQCLPPGTVLDGGVVDGSTVAPDAGAHDGGPTPADAGMDAALPDAALPDGAISDGAVSDAMDVSATRCLELSGAWTVESSTPDCGPVSFTMTFTPSDSRRCEYTASTNDMTVIVDPSGGITGTATLPTSPPTLVDCSGTTGGGELMVSCGGCALSLSR